MSERCDRCGAMPSTVVTARWKLCPSWECESCIAVPDSMREMVHEMAALRTRLATAERELAEARDQRDASFEDARSLNECLERADTTRREWEVRAATSYRDGRAAGLREAAGMCRDVGSKQGPHYGGDIAYRCRDRILALLGPGEVES